MDTEERSTLLLKDLDQVHGLATDVPALRRDYRRIRLELPELPDSARETWERRLNRHLRGDGTELAAVGYVVALLAYALYAWLVGGAAPTSLDALSVGVALMVGGAAVGKVIGLMLANRALRQSAFLLEALVRATERAPAPRPSGHTPEPDPHGRLVRVA